MTHLSREELARWWREGPESDRERIVSHLAVCDDCGALYGDLIDAQPLPTSLAPETRPDLVARALRAFRLPRRGLRTFLSPPALAAVAAAAALLVAIGVVTLRPTADPGGIRGTSLQPLSPIGQARPPVEFRWESPVRASRYRLEVLDAGGGSLFVLFSDAESLSLPEEQFEELEPGREYSWEVVALGPAGEEIMKAPRRSFSVSGSP
jgi:hypothetical protein